MQNNDQTPETNTHEQQRRRNRFVNGGWLSYKLQDAINPDK
jgi:hypothetical protein